MSFTHQTQVMHDGEELTVKLYYDYIPPEKGVFGRIKEPEGYSIQRIEVEDEHGYWCAAPNLMRELNLYDLAKDIKAGRENVAQ